MIAPIRSLWKLISVSRIIRLKKPALIFGGLIGNKEQLPTTGIGSFVDAQSSALDLDATARNAVSSSPVGRD